MHQSNKASNQIQDQQNLHTIYTNKTRKSLIIHNKFLKKQNSNNTAIKRYINQNSPPSTNYEKILQSLQTPKTPKVQSNPQQKQQQQSQNKLPMPRTFTEQKYLQYVSDQYLEQQKLQELQKTTKKNSYYNMNLNPEEQTKINSQNNYPDIKRNYFKSFVNFKLKVQNINQKQSQTPSENIDNINNFNNNNQIQNKKNSVYQSSFTQRNSNPSQNRVKTQQNSDRSSQSSKFSVFKFPEKKQKNLSIDIPEPPELSLNVNKITDKKPQKPYKFQELKSQNNTPRSFGQNNNNNERICVTTKNSDQQQQQQLQLNNSYFGSNLKSSPYLVLQPNIIHSEQNIKEINNSFQQRNNGLTPQEKENNTQIIKKLDRKQFFHSSKFQLLEKQTSFNETSFNNSSSNNINNNNKNNFNLTQSNKQQQQKFSNFEKQQQYRTSKYKPIQQQQSEKKEQEYFNSQQPFFDSIYSRKQSSQLNNKLKQNDHFQQIQQSKRKTKSIALDVSNKHSLKQQFNMSQDTSQHTTPRSSFMKPKYNNMFSFKQTENEYEL